MRNKDFKEAYQYALKHIDYPASEMKEYLQDDVWHIGYCEVEEDDFKNAFYPNHKFYRLTEEYQEKYKDVPKHLMRQDDNKNSNFHCLVWQTCQFEDDYSGYILFPLTTGKYWIVGFNC